MNKGHNYTFDFEMALSETFNDVAPEMNWGAAGTIDNDEVATVLLERVATNMSDTVLAKWNALSLDAKRTLAQTIQ